MDDGHFLGSLSIEQTAAVPPSHAQVGHSRLSKAVVQFAQPWYDVAGTNQPILISNSGPHDKRSVAGTLVPATDSRL